MLKRVICLVDRYDLRAGCTSISDRPNTRYRSSHILTPRYGVSLWTVSPSTVNQLLVEAAASSLNSMGDMSCASSTTTWR